MIGADFDADEDKFFKDFFSSFFLQDSQDISFKFTELAVVAAVESLSLKLFHIYLIQN